jgi:hypothetical protein
MRWTVIALVVLGSLGSPRALPEAPLPPALHAFVKVDAATDGIATFA